jgi:hypothetical protein
VLAASLLSLAAACSDDDEPSEEGDEPEGEECFSPGRVMVGCSCGGDRPPGSRQCMNSGIWGRCSCPPAGEPGDCMFEGQVVQCFPCPGEGDAGRITECLAGGTFDCSCSRDGGVRRDGG